MKSGLETRDEGQEEMEYFKNRTRMTRIFKRGFNGFSLLSYNILVS